MHSTVTKRIMRRLLVVSQLETIKNLASCKNYISINYDPSYITELVLAGTPIGGTSTKWRIEKQQLYYNNHQS